MSFAWKHDIFTCTNNKLSSHLKRSPLLWLHNKLRLLLQKTMKVKRFGISSVFIKIIINRTLHGRLEIRNFSSCVEKEKFRISARPCNILYSCQTTTTEVSFQWSHTIGFHPQIQKLKWEFIHLQVRWVSLHVGVSVVTHSFTVKINLNYQGTCKWLFI